MDLTDCLSPRCIVPGLASTDRQGVLRELVDVLAEAGHLSDRDTALERILEREGLESTCIGGGLAVPHARITGLPTLVLALGRSRAGIDFQSLDGTPARVVFLLLYPPREGARHLSFLSVVSTLALRHRLVERLLAARSAEKMLGVLEACQREEHLSHVGALAAEAAGTQPDWLSDARGLVHPLLGLLARLQRLEQFRQARAAAGPDASSPSAGEEPEPVPVALADKVRNIRSLVPTRYLAHFDRLMQRGGAAVVSVEDWTCQGCNMQFASSFRQEMSEQRRIFTCPTCRRFLVLV